MRKTIFTAIMCMAISGLTAIAGNYNVKVKAHEDTDFSMAYLIDYDTNDTIAVSHVENATVLFTGNIGEPRVVRFNIGDMRFGEFILEDGDIEYDMLARVATGTELNKKNAQLDKNVQEIAERFQSAESDEAQEAIWTEYQLFLDKQLEENKTNPIGYMIFMQKAYEMEPAELIAYVEENPYFKKFRRVNKLIEANRNKMATSEGGKFRDFEIEYDGVKHRLSDVVGKGDYVLVDFWASWCGPCIRQTAVLKDIYNDYKDKGLKILGVAVWDEPQNTLEAIEQHELPWECWINGQSIPTDEYGISGIPCIILFGPDGTILSRDKQSDALKADVAKALGAKN